MSSKVFAQNPVGCCQINLTPDQQANDMVKDGEIINSCALCSEIHKGYDNVILSEVMPSSPGGKVEETFEYKDAQVKLQVCRDLSRDLIRSITSLNTTTKDYLVSTGELKGSDHSNQSITLLKSIETMKIISSAIKASSNPEPKSGAEDNECLSDEEVKKSKDLISDMLGKLKMVKQSYESLQRGCPYYYGAANPAHKQQEEAVLKVINETIKLYDK